MIFNIKKLHISKNKKLFKFSIGLKFFNLGVFFLVSAPAIAGILLLISTIISSFDSEINYFQDKSNKIFILSSILIIFTTLINHYYHTENNTLPGYQPFVNWIGILNWIPYFYCFWAFQKFLDTSLLRKNTAINLISGSIPLIFSIIGQYWFGWYGPFKAFNGLLIWFQRPINSESGVTGLFNNQNYTGAWLVIIFPFIIACFYQISHSKLQKFMLSIFISLVGTFIYLTKSRNAVLGSILSLQLFYQNKYFFLFLILLVLIGIYLISLNDIFSKELFFGNFSNISFNFESFTRFNILKESINFIAERPFLGWGSASFPLLLISRKFEWYGHSHNIFFELAISYGLISAALIGYKIFSILLRSFNFIYLLKQFSTKKVERQHYYFDKAWWTATTVLLFSQFFDIQYFDFRIGMIFWIFLSGLSKIKN